MTTQQDKMITAAKNRMEALGFTESDNEVLFYDWPNFDEHIEWLLSADKDEIASWIEAVSDEDTSINYEDAYDNLSFGSICKIYPA